MARISSSLICSLVFFALGASCAARRAAFPELEHPGYTLLHSDSEYEIREYDETVWAVAEVTEVSFTTATTQGFHRLFEYIEGGNTNWTKIAMTTPVLTGIVPSAGPFCSSAFAVRLYLPKNFHEAPPTPLPELDITFERWGKQTIAIKQFSGYAQDNNVARQAERLAISLSKSEFTKNATYPIGDKDSYAIAQYNSPFQFWNRVNEVWVNIKVPGYEATSEEDVPLLMVTNES